MDTPQVDMNANLNPAPPPEEPNLPSGAQGIAPASPMPSNAMSPDNTAMPEMEKHSRVGQMFHSVLSALGGANDTAVTVDPNTGNTVETQTPSKPGDQFKRILAGALTGMAAGATQPRPGFAKGIGVGGVASMQLRQQMADRQREQAQQEFANMDRAKLRQASIALQTQQMAESSLRMAREGTAIDEQTADKINAMSSLVSSDPNNKDFGHYSSFEEILKLHPEWQTRLTSLQSQGMLRAIPTTENGKITGVQVYEIHPGWADQKITEPKDIYTVSGMDNKGNPTYTKQTIPAGAATNGQVMQWQTASLQGQFNAQRETQPTAKDRFVQGEEDARSAAKEKESQSKEGRKWVTWSQNGKDVAGPASMAPQGSNPAELPAQEVRDVSNARRVLNLINKQGDPKKPETMGVLQLIDSLDKDGKLGVLTSRYNRFLTQGVGTSPSDDPRIITLINKNMLADTAAMLAHFGASGGRSPAMLKHFTDLADAGKMDATTLRSGIKAIGDYMEDRAMMPNTSGTAPSQFIYGGFQFPDQASLDAYKKAKGDK